MAHSMISRLIAGRLSSLACSGAPTTQHHRFGSILTSSASYCSQAATSSSSSTPPTATPSLPPLSDILSAIKRSHNDPFVEATLTRTWDAAVAAKDRAADAERRAMDAKDRAADAERCTDRLEHRLQVVVAEAMRTRGLLHMRGVMEMFEEEVKRLNPKLQGKNRIDFYTAFFESAALDKGDAVLVGSVALDFIKCVQAKLQKQESAPKRMITRLAGIYDALSADIHGKFSQAKRNKDTVVITTGGVLPFSSCLVVECMAKVLGAPCHLDMPKSEVPGLDGAE